MRRDKKTGIALVEVRGGAPAEIRHVVTDDFVHFVIHVAANSSGAHCEMCRMSGPIRYA